MSPVEEYILEQPGKVKSLILKLRDFIVSASPFIEEKLVYGIPFFYAKSRVFYINPKKDLIELGFCKGHLMAENPILRTKNRTQVKTIEFGELNEIEENTLLPLIHEGFIIDEQN